MHILLVHQAFAALDEAGGTRHHELARHLVRLGHRVTIIASPVSYMTGKNRSEKSILIDQQVDEPGITILRVFTYSALHRSFIHRVVSFFSFMISSFIAGLGVKKVDIVWGTTPPIFQGVTAWLLARLKRVPFLFEVRDLWPAFAIAVGVLRNRIIITASEWLEHFLYRHADWIMVNSPGYINHVCERGGKRVNLVPNGTDPDMFDPNYDSRTLRHQLGFDGKYIVLYAGAHGLSNDLNIVLQAANLLQERHDICFVLVGDGKEKPALQKQAMDMNLVNVVFLPPIAKSSIAATLAAANACIAILKPIDLYKTTYPNKVFDYMAAGRPVILAIDGVIREVIDDAKCGIAVRPGDADELAQAVLTLANDPIKGHKMGISGRQYIEKNFNRFELARQLNDLLNKIVKTHNK